MNRLGRLLAILVVSSTCAGWLPLIAGDFEARYGVKYVDRSSGPLKADTYVPKDEGPHPGVLVVHGGAWRMGTRAQFSGVAQLLAQHGFSAVAISYRLAPQDKFPAQIEDCKAAVRWMRTHAAELKLDPKRIGGFGYSAGAHLVALLGTTDIQDGLEGVKDPVHQPSSRIQAVVGGGTPCDFRGMPVDQRWLSFWLGGTRGEMAEQYRLASPASFVTADDPPMFFFHGENDDLVPISQPQGMCRVLSQVSVPVEFYMVPKLGHIAAGMDRTALDKCVEFFVRQLENQDSP